MITVISRVESCRVSFELVFREYLGVVGRGEVKRFVLGREGSDRVGVFVVFLLLGFGFRDFSFFRFRRRFGRGLRGCSGRGIRCWWRYMGFCLVLRLVSLG